MKIRSITCFLDPNSTKTAEEFNKLALFSKALEENLQNAGYEVETRRLATTPFSIFLEAGNDADLLKKVLALQENAKTYGFAYLSCGPALPSSAHSYELLPDLLASTNDVFFGAIIADEKQIYPEAVKLAARAITRISTITADGFTNLRFAALANVPAGAPFFPAAYQHPENPIAFSVALECADVVLESFKNALSLESARLALLEELNSTADRIAKIIHQTDIHSNVCFLGFDFSPAPYPEDGCSLAGAIEAIGRFTIGREGSLAAAAVLADTLDRGQWKRAGFNGLMLPVLEDSVLAKRAATGELSVKDLLLYSAVCGTGLDTIPLAGDTSADEITSVLMDVAALSVRLRKPLTARLMPLPGKSVGDATNFEFSYFANSRVMALSSQQIHPPLMENKPISLAPRNTYNHR